MSSLRGRIIFSMLAIIFLIVAGSNFVIRDIQTGIIEGEFRNEGFLLANNLAHEFSNYFLINDLVEIRKSIDNAKKSYPEIEYIFVTDENGNVIVHSFEKGFPKALMDFADPKNVSKEEILITTNGTIHEFDAALFKDIGFVHIGLSENKVVTQIQDASYKILLLAISAIILGAIFVYFIGKRLTEPVLKLTEGAKRINKGILDQKIETDSKDELGELAKTFNEMSSNLDQKIKELVVRNRELTVVNEISKNISEASDLDTMLSMSLESILKLQNFEYGEIHLLNEKTGQFILKNKIGEKRPDYDSYAVIQLKSKEKALGMIKIGVKEDHSVSEKDEELFSAIGNQIGVAIENIGFYDNLRYLKEFNDEILNHINLALHVIDRDFKIIAINNELIKLSNGRLKKNGIINRNIFDVYPFLKEKHVDMEYEHVIKTGEILQTEEKTQYYDEIIFTVTSKIPIKDRKGNVEKIITIIKDVSEQKKLEEELKDSYEELKLTYSKLKELYKIKDNFLSNISHELRTPLTSVMGYTELMLDENLTEQQRHKTEIIFRNSKRLYRLIRGLLDTQIIETSNIQLYKDTVLLNKIVVDVVEDMKNLAEVKKIPIRIDIPQILMTQGDNERLIQVFSNILENAIKFTITGEIIIKGYIEEDNVHIAFTDTGVGIAEDQLEKIFDKFYQVDSSDRRKFQGAGLGLWISKKIIEAHGGKIWAESKNRGSTFHILLKTLEK